MSDVFLSYASADRSRVAPLAKALVDAGFTLWWDRHIRAGADFSATIELEIQAARAVVVVWSESSVSSQWVRDEASYASKERKLIPLQLDKTEAPMGFRQIQAIDFREWRDDPMSPAFASLATAVRDLLTRDGSSPVRAAPTHAFSARARSFVLRRRGPLLAALALIAGSLATWGILTSSYAPGSHAVAMGQVAVQSFVARPSDPERAARAESYAGAFRQRFAEVGIRISPASAAGNAPKSELILVGDLTDEGGKNVLTAHIEDRESGATVWSIRANPTEGAAWESNLAAFSLKCALKRRDPHLGVDVLSRYVSGCAHFLEGDFAALHAVAKELHDAAPTNSNVLGFYAFAHAGLGWSGARSKAEHDRLVGEGARIAEQALKLDPQNADALFTMGFVKSDSQFEEQEQWWRRALAADPELGWALGRYANLLTTVGRIREAVDIGLRAQLHRRMTHVAVAQALASIGELDEARSQFDLVRPMDPQYVGRQEMAVEVFYGDIDKTATKLREHPTLGGESLECWTDVLAARRKRPSDTVRLARDCGPSGDSSVRAFALAGDLDAAYHGVDLYLKSGERFIPQIFWPEMRDFIRDARFWPLAARLGLVAYWLDTKQWPDFCAEPDLPFSCATEAAKVRASGPAT